MVDTTPLVDSGKEEKIGWWKILTVGGTQFDAFMMEGE
jgi:hypothetical protein